MNSEPSAQRKNAVPVKLERSLDRRGVAVIVAATAFLLLWCGLCMGLWGDPQSGASRQTRRAQQCSGADMSFPESLLPSLY